MTTFPVWIPRCESSTICVHHLKQHIPDIVHSKQVEGSTKWG